MAIGQKLEEARKDKNALRVRIEGLALLKSTLKKSMESNAEEAKIVGIDIISDKLTLLSREKPRSIAPEIVFPDLDVPGIRAKVCQIPIIIASRYDQSLLIRLFLPYLSDI